MSLSLEMCAGPWARLGKLTGLWVGSADHFDHVGDLGDHTAHCRRILQRALAPDPIETKAHQGGALVGLAPDRTAGLANGDLGHDGVPQLAASAASAALSAPRRPTRSPTFLPRLAATWRGEDWTFSASNVARTMLYGLEEPTDLATTSWTPRVSSTARIGHPAITPVPGGAERIMILPAPQRPWPS